MPISMSYFGTRRPGKQGAKPVWKKQVDKMPFGKDNPIDWMTGKHLVQFRKDEPVASVVTSSDTGAGSVIPVRLVCTNDDSSECSYGGDAVACIGSAEAPPQLLYDVYELTATVGVDDPLMSGVNPVEDPHEFRRPSVGLAIPATFGYLHAIDGGLFALGWINEIIDTAACEESA